MSQKNFVPFYFLACSLALVVFVSSCSSSNSNPGGGQSPNSSSQNPSSTLPSQVPAKSPEEAIQRLSDSQRKAFEAWKGQLVKSCDASEAFGMPDARSKEINPSGLDLKIFLEKNNHSLIFKGAHGEIAILGQPGTFAGVGKSKVEQTDDIDGKKYSLQADTQRQGFMCSLNLYGQKVHEASITSGFDVVGYWEPGQVTEPVQEQSVLKTNAFSSLGLMEVPEHGIVDSVSGGFNTGKNAIQFLTSQLGIPTNESNHLFYLNSGSTANSLRLLNDSNALWLNERNKALVGSIDNIEKLFGGTQQSADFEWKVAVPKVSVGDLKNDSDTGNLKFTVTVNIYPTPDKPQYFSYSLKSVRSEGLVPYDNTEASQCVKSRTLTLKSISTKGSPNTILPVTEEAFGPCSVLSDDLEALVYSDGTFKDLIPSLFSGVTPSPAMNYNGWDAVLGKLGLRFLDEGKNIRSELDPSGRMPTVQALDNYLTQLKAGIQKASKLSSSSALVYQMGLNWTFTGQQVSSARVSEILETADRTLTPFKVSTESLLRSLSRASESNQDVLTFAKAIGDDYKTEANRSLSLATSLEYKGWETGYFDQILQKKISLTELQGWSNELQKVQTEIVKYPNLNSVKGQLTESTINWVKNRELELDQVGSIYGALNNSLDPFQDSTHLLIENTSTSLTKNRASIDFAQGITGEYKRQAILARDLAKTVGLEDWSKSTFASILQLMPTQAQFGVWNTTLQAALQYTQREQSRIANGSEPFADDSRKSIVTAALKEGWISDDFTSLEQIAEFGRFKTTCGDKKSASSIADCAGMALFSRGAKKFLDPLLTRRYGSLAGDFVRYMGVLTPEQDYFSLRTNLVDSFFSNSAVLWASCDTGRFQQKTSALANQISAISQESDQLKKWDIEATIRQTLADCN